MNQKKANLFIWAVFIIICVAVLYFGLKEEERLPLNLHVEKSGNFLVVFNSHGECLEDVLFVLNDWYSFTINKIKPYEAVCIPLVYFKNDRGKSFSVLDKVETLVVLCNIGNKEYGAGFSFR